VRKCGSCGLTGHYRSTCPDKKIEDTKPSVKKAKEGGRRCGGCGQSGHDKRNCPHKDGTKPKPSVKIAKIEENEQGDGDYEETLCDENWKPLKKEKKKIVTCSVCGDEGHNAASCYYSKPALDALGPTIMECGHFTWWMDDGKCSRCCQLQRMRRQEYEAA
tara:strand:- start:619 stop:1101 length:483 start_codon:yes stop_codon:yes gene_type:complete